MKKLRTVTLLLIVLAIVVAHAVPACAEGTEKVNINSASVEELLRLDRVGTKYAERIVAYREANGPFKSPEEIMNVAGIGQKIYEVNKDVISVK